MPTLWPSDLRPTTAAFWLEPNTVATTSQLSRATRTIIRPGGRWRCDLTFEHKDPASSARLDGLLAGLGGAGEEAYLWDFRRPFPVLFGAGWRDPPAGTFQLLYGANPGDGYITTAGWQQNQQIFQSGDYVGIGGRIYINCTATSSDGEGRLVMEIRPLVLNAMAAGTPVTTYQPTSRFRLADGSQGANRTQAGRFSSYAVSFIESLP